MRTGMQDRHFVAFVEVVMPWCSSPHCWQPVSTEIFLFEQPDMPSHEQIISTAKKECPIAQSLNITNFYPISEVDFILFMSGSNEWQLTT